MDFGSQANGSDPEPSATADGGKPGERALADFLGWASFGLGVPQTLAPGHFDRSIGIEPDARARAVTVLACGVRELAAAGGILALERPRPVRWLWARVAGDALDLMLLSRALRSQPEQPSRVLAAMGAVAGIAAADLYAAVRVGRAPDRATEEEAMRVKAAITVRRPVEEVYGFWRDLQNLPQFMYHLESVEVSGDGRSHWKAKAPVGTVEWEAEVVEDRANEVIAWRSVEGASVPNRGTVRFAPAPQGQGTEVAVELEYQPPGGALGKAVAKLFGEEPNQQISDDLRRFKQVLETGEVVKSEGSPDGSRTQRQFWQHEAQPLEEFTR